MIDSSDLKLNQLQRDMSLLTDFLCLCIYFSIYRVSELAAILGKLPLPITTYMLCD